MGLFVIVATVYFATFVGVTSSNDGSHYALVRAISARQGFEISAYLSFAEEQDYAIGPGGKYSDRPPGTALWTTPFYVVARYMPPPLVHTPSKHDRGNPRLMGVGAATAVAGAASVATFWLLVRRRFGVGAYAANFAAVALAFGTVTWKYGSVLYSHALSAALLLAALYLALDERRDPRRALLLGLALGASVLAEYSNALAVLVVGTWWLASAARTTPWLALGGLPAAAFLAAYNTLNFGGPFRLSSFMVDTTRWPNAANLATAFASPLTDGLVGLLVWGSNNQGIFLLSPIVLLSLLGVVPLLRTRPREGALVLGLFLVHLIAFAMSTNFNPTTNDGRYLAPFLALWLIPLAFWLDRSFDPKHLPHALLVFGLLFLSIRNQFMHIAFSWNYDLKYADLTNMSTPLPNITRVLSTVFPNALNVWWLWILLLPIVLLIRR